MRKAPVAIPVLICVLLAVLVLAAYAPGLHGGFLFDDFGNLPALGATGPVDTWPTFWRYLTSGTADPTGRPLALLSFLIDAHNWPADPRPFLRTNLILHLLNGVLLALLLRRLGHALLPTSLAVPVAPVGAASAAIGAAGDSKSIAAEAAPTEGRTGERFDLGWRVDLAAVLGAALWMLHPLLVSTTLYIVQREAMLPATFTLLGLLLWLHGRTRLLRGHTVGGLAWVTLGLGGCTLLAVLSKANGILLPALALLIEYILLRPPHAPVGAAHGRDRQRMETAISTMRVDAAGVGAVGPSYKGAAAYRWALVVLGWLPAALVAGYLLYQGWNGLAHGIGSRRPWTLGQRLLTEPRVLMDYLDLLWLPRPFTPGLFNDQIQASTSLFSPATTLPALLAVLGLIAGACFLRRKLPAVALAILFYFVGQALESSTIALELYYEHRNYLPAMLMFWPLALWLCGVRQTSLAPVGAPEGATPGLDASPNVPDFGTHPVAPSGAPTKAHGVAAGNAPDVWGKAKTVLTVILVLGLALMTHARANLWGNSHDQALLWAKLNPASPRAQASAAQAEMNAGHPERATARLRPALAKSPDQVQLALNLFGAECQAGHIDNSTLTASATALRTTRDPGSLLVHWFERAIVQSKNPPCPQLTLHAIATLVDAAQHNPHLMKVAGRRQDLYYLQGRLALAKNDGDSALADFNRALDQQVRITGALQQAALLGSNGFPRQGLAHLDHYAAERDKGTKPGFGMPSVHAWVLHRQHYWSKETARLRATLREDAQRQAASSE